MTADLRVDVASLLDDLKTHARLTAYYAVLTTREHEIPDAIAVSMPYARCSRLPTDAAILADLVINPIAQGRAEASAWLQQTAAIRDELRRERDALKSAQTRLAGQAQDLEARTRTISQRETTLAKQEIEVQQRTKTVAAFEDVAAAIRELERKQQALGYARRDMDLELSAARGRIRVEERQAARTRTEEWAAQRREEAAATTARLAAEADALAARGRQLAHAQQAFRRHRKRATWGLAACGLLVAAGLGLPLQRLWRPFRAEIAELRHARAEIAQARVDVSSRERRTAAFETLVARRDSISRVAARSAANRLQEATRREATLRTGEQTLALRLRVVEERERRIAERERGVPGRAGPSTRDGGCTVRASAASPNACPSATEVEVNFVLTVPNADMAEVTIGTRTVRVGRWGATARLPGGRQSYTAFARGSVWTGSAWRLLTWGGNGVLDLRPNARFVVAGSYPTLVVVTR